MANEYLVNSADLTSVADAIREKGETTEQLVFPADFVTAIQAINGGDLNFEVVGGETVPENPAENTIWVNTPTEITDWEICEYELNLAQTELYEDISLSSNTYLKLDGGSGSSENWSVTDYIQLPYNTKTITVYDVSTTSTNVAHIFYDADGKRVSIVERKTGTYTYTVPSGATQVRLSIRINNTSPSVIAEHEEVREQGFVFLSLSIYAVKGDEITIRPTYCIQSVGSEWVDKDISVYRNGVWTHLDGSVSYAALVEEAEDMEAALNLLGVNADE